MPERAVSELAELGLLAAARQVELLSGVVLDPESFTSEMREAVENIS